MRKSNLFALLAAAAAILVSSCNKENLRTNAEDGPLGPTSFVGYIGDVDTKTTLDGVKVKWVEGDEISVNGKTYVASPDPENPQKAIFNLKAGQTAPTGTTFRAYYPASTFVSTSYTQRFKLATTQTYNGDDISGVNPMFAVANTNEGGTFEFKNVCGLLAVDVVGDEAVKSIKVTANTYIAGTLSNLALSGDNLTYTSWVTSGRSSSVTLNCPEAVQLDPVNAKTFYIAIPYRSTAYTSFKLDITCASGKVKSIAASKSVSIERGHIYHIPAKVSFPVLDFNAVLSVDKNETVSASSVDLEVSVTPEDKNVTYVLALESTGYVGQFASDLELAQEDIAYWQSQGVTQLSQLVNAGLAFKGDLKNHKDFSEYAKPNSDMVLYAYAVDNEFSVSPAIKLPIHFDEYVFPAVSASYEDYLGQWIMGDDLITVSQKVAGSTYNVAGIKNQNYPTYNYNVEAVEATFENGYIVLKEQKTGATTSVGSYGTCDVYLSGVFAQGTSTYGYYPLNSGTNAPCEIFRGACEGDKITVTAGSCQYGTFQSMGFSWVIQSGTNKGRGNTFAGTTLRDMTRYSDPTGPTPEGDWYCASVSDYWGDTYADWTMKITKDGLGYRIENFDQGFDEFLESQVAGLRSTAPVAIWDNSAKTLTVANGTTTGISAGTTAFDFIGIDPSTSTESDIILQFDFDNNTCQYITPAWGVYATADSADESGWYTLYRGNQVFAKVEASAAPAKAKYYGGNIRLSKSFARATPFMRRSVKNAPAQIAVMPEVKVSANAKMIRSL